MGKIVASYLLKVHLHVDDEAAVPSVEETNEQVSQAVIDGITDNLGYEATVSQIDRVDE